MGANSGPGFKSYPDHCITTKPAGVHVQIRLNGEVIADTRDAIQLEEPHVGHVVAPVVYYIPRKDVRMEDWNKWGQFSPTPFSAGFRRAPRTWPSAAPTPSATSPA